MAMPTLMWDFASAAPAASIAASRASASALPKVKLLTVRIRCHPKSKPAYGRQAHNDADRRAIPARRSAASCVSTLGLRATPPGDGGLGRTRIDRRSQRAPLGFARFDRRLRRQGAKRRALLISGEGMAEHAAADDAGGRCRPLACPFAELVSGQPPAPAPTSVPQPH